MQDFSATLSEAVDPDQLKRSWDIDHEQDHSPKVRFDVEGKKVQVTVFSNPDTPWNEANFKQAFNIAVHRFAPNCAIEWV
jgi:hypothetical protein